MGPSVPQDALLVAGLWGEGLGQASGLGLWCGGPGLKGRINTGMRGLSTVNIYQPEQDFNFNSL